MRSSNFRRNGNAFLNAIEVSPVKNKRWGAKRERRTKSKRGTKKVSLHKHGTAANKNNSEAARWLNDLVGFLFCVAPHCSPSSSRNRARLQTNQRRRHFWVYQTITLGEVAFNTRRTTGRSYFLFPFFLPFLFLLSPTPSSCTVLRILLQFLIRTNSLCTCFSLDDETIENNCSSRNFV